MSQYIKSNKGFDKNEISITTFHSYLSKKKHEKNPLAEPNKMIAQLMVQLTDAQSGIDKEKEEKKKLEETIQKLNLSLTEEKSYKNKFQEILNQGMVYTEEINELKKTVEKKCSEIESNKNTMKEMDEEKKKEIEEINKVNKEIQDFYLEEIQNKEKEILNLKHKIEEVKNTPTNEKEDQLLKYQKVLEGKNDQIENELGTQNAKLISLAEAYKNLDSKAEQSKMEYEKSIEVAQNRITEMQTNYLMNNEELVKMKKAHRDVTTKLNDALSYIKTLQVQNETIKDEINTLKKEHEETVEKLKERVNKGSTSSVGLNNLKEIITEHMLQLYKLEHSVAYSDIIDKTLFSFNQIAQATFDLIHTSGTVTVYHENLKELYFRIYSSINPNQIAINGCEVSNQTSKAISNEIFKRNFFDILEQKQYVNQYAETLEAFGLDEEAINEIKTMYESKASKYQQSALSSIQAFVDKCLSTIKNGTIEINKKQIYSFKDYFIPTTEIRRNILFIDNSQSTEDSIHYLFSLIKYPHEKINSIEMLGRFLNSEISEKTIKKLFFYLMTYHPNIELFTLNGCELNSNTISYLSLMLEHMKKLVTIRLDSGSISDDNIKILSDILKNNKTLKELYMNKDNISSAGAFFLADCLTLNKTIKKLSLSCNRINDEGLQTLLNVIITDSPIEIIDLSYNLFQEKDFKIISDFLLKNPKIHSLSLNGNFLDMACSISLGMCLDKVTNLKVLNMSNMNITSDFTPVLFSKFFIEELILDDNPLDEIGHIMLAKALTSNNSLRKLSLKNTKVCSLGLTHTLNRMKTNKKLEEMHLENNTLDDNSLIILGSFAKDKSCNIYISKRNVTTPKNIELFDKIKNVILV